jgi:hypothetical protein
VSGTRDVGNDGPMVLKDAVKCLCAFESSLEAVPTGLQNPIVVDTLRC